MSDLRDERGGAYDPVNELGEPVPVDKVRDKETPHQREQPGADVRGEPELPTPDAPLPEGLRRQRKGPYNKDQGRESRHDS